MNEAICHGIPDQRRLQEGDIINIGTFGPVGLLRLLTFKSSDVTLYYDGMICGYSDKGIYVIASTNRIPR